jgi:hypothetical protein
LKVDVPKRYLVFWLPTPRPRRGTGSSPTAFPRNVEVDPWIQPIIDTVFNSMTTTIWGSIQIQ